ncbi:MAG: hypothetical protein ABEJ28_03680 [Salinigranum sp.]
MIGPADLRGMALYGVDRDDAEALFRRHFGRSFRVDTPADDSTGWLAGRVDLSPRGALVRRSAPALVAVALAVLVIGGVLLPPGGGSIDSAAGGGADVGRHTAVDAPTSTPTPAVTPALPATVAEASRDGYPPGVTADGVENLTELARAHRALAARRSYRLDVEHIELENGSVTGRVRERTTVESRYRYATSIDRTGRTRMYPFAVAPHEVYADGRRLYVHREGESVPYQVKPLGTSAEGPPSERAGIVIQEFLKTLHTSVRRRSAAGPWSPPDRTDRNWTRRVYVEGTGTTYPRAKHYRVTASVSPRGFVYSFRARYAVPGTNVTVLSTFTYTDVGNATVRPPAWYERPRTERSKTERSRA